MSISIRHDNSIFGGLSQLDGILKIVLKKVQRTKAKKIEIK